ncbi:MAG: phenylalanine--tRNA ligase subunit beta [Deltaproteobacteria bacterium]|nr:phenylalanine--tRNA ligase subunit beta [Deltaproteobacteria bacterium]
MKLPIALLQKFIDLPENDVDLLRRVFDDLGLEVKAVEGAADQAVFTIETLANRGDHLSVAGIAREISARYLSAVRQPAIAPEISDRKTSIPVRNLTDKCLRYALMELTLPPRMQLRQDVASFLDAGGGKHAIVDLLNYVQLELGQPMHAFDKEKVEGEVVIELTQKEEVVDALDGRQYKVPPASIVIKDKKKILAVGGVIGCSNSMVTAQTERVLVESAAFDPISVRKTARSMGIATEASQLFGRGSDREMVITALKRLLGLCAATAGAKDDGSAHVLGLTLVDGAALEKRRLNLDIGLIRKHMNLPRLEAVEVAARLKHLGFSVQTGEGDKELTVTVPSWRLWDVDSFQDLIEEFARSHGYSRVKQVLPPLDYDLPSPSPMEVLVDRIEASVLGSGFSEVITKGFYSASDVAMLGKLSPELAAQHIGVINAVESNYSHMKITNLIHLARLAESNHRKGVLSVKVYELSRLFNAKENSDGPYEYERDVLTLAASGRWNENEWRKAESRDQSAYLFKGVLESVFAALGLRLEVQAARYPLLHPGVQAEIVIGKENVGRFGLIHPDLKEELELKSDLFYAELDINSLSRSMRDGSYREAFEYPSVRRDLTLKVEPERLASQISKMIFSCGAALLTDVSIVDDFRKPEENFRRTTFRLTFQSGERTLETPEVDREIDLILNELRQKHSVEISA